MEIRIESDLVYSAIAVLFKEGEQSERAAARLPRPTRCAAGAGAWWRMRRVPAEAAPAQPSTLRTISNRRVQGVSVHDLRGRFPVRLLPVFSSTDFPSVLLVRAGLIRPAGGICRGLRYIWLCFLVVSLIAVTTFSDLRSRWCEPSSVLFLTSARLMRVGIGD